MSEAVRVFGEDENDEYPCRTMDDMDLYCELVVDHPARHRFPPLTSDSGPRWRD